MYPLIALRRAAAVSRSMFANNSVKHTRLYSSTMHDNDPDLLESEKRKNLGNTQHHTSTPHAYAPGWNEHLASASEAHVKADKSTEPIEKLTRRTVDYIQKRHTPEDRIETQEASYERDEVTGPLGSAVGSEGLSDEEYAAGARKIDARRVVKTRVCEEVVEDHATPSEQAVRADRGEV